MKKFLIATILCVSVLVSGCSEKEGVPDKYAEEVSYEYDSNCFDDYSGLWQIDKDEMSEYLERTFYDVCGLQPYFFSRTSMQEINGMNEAWEYWDDLLGKFENQNFVAFCYIDKIENGIKNDIRPNCCWTVIVGRDVKVPEGMTREDLREKMDMLINTTWRTSSDWQRVELPFIGFAVWYNEQFE